jgi:hypothetical protein
LHRRNGISISVRSAQHYVDDAGLEGGLFEEVFEPNSPPECIADEVASDGVTYTFEGGVLLYGGEFSNLFIRERERVVDESADPKDPSPEIHIGI